VGPRVRVASIAVLAAVAVSGAGCGRPASPVPSGVAVATPTAGTTPTPPAVAASPSATTVRPAEAGSETAGAPVPGRLPIGDAGALRDLVRDDLQGFQAKPLTAGPFSLSRAYVPADRSRLDALAVTVERFRDAASAERRITESVGRRFPGGGPASAAGLKGYFGTSDRSAALALDDSGVVLTLEAHASGAAPSALKADLVSMAESLLD
jgi:hypothetical protein